MSKNQTQLRAYPSPLYFKFVKALANYTGESESQIVCDAIKLKFESTPPQEREKILRFSE